MLNIKEKNRAGKRDRKSVCGGGGGEMIAR